MENIKEGDIILIDNHGESEFTIIAISEHYPFFFAENEDTKELVKVPAQVSITLIEASAFPDSGVSLAIALERDKIEMRATEVKADLFISLFNGTNDVDRSINGCKAAATELNLKFPDEDR